MNCREIQDKLIAARDAEAGSPLDPASARHVASCPDCQAMQRQLDAAAQVWRENSQAVPVPDATREWHAVRRRIRQDADAGATSRGWASWPRLLRVAAPLTAVAALALVIWQGGAFRDPVPPDQGTSQVASFDEDAFAAEFEDHFAFVAHAEYVETDNQDASPFVYVDDESGWLIVWASDPPDTDGASI